jgi:hypothetical protein
MEMGVPADAVAFFARWWQLETWLRQLVYMELRAKHGTEWLQHLSDQAPTRAARDEINTYMATPDAANLLAYLDVGHLFDLIGNSEHWPQSPRWQEPVRGSSHGDSSLSSAVSELPRAATSASQVWR